MQKQGGVPKKKAFRIDCLETIQKKTEDAAKEIAHTTKFEREWEEGRSREV